MLQGFAGVDSALCNGGFLAMLTKSELEYFDNLQNYIKKTLGISVKVLPCSHYNVYSLIETICHELAHLFIWEHGEEHTRLTQEFTNIFVQQVN